ncbi:MAG: DUF2203 domain-containing protein [Candidatus Omnitrophica bacterium]|nr:DUF2203 domain-containing protein [Candidatus Omnitrophota bacterium]
MPPKTFTVAEANALLPQVIPLIEQLQGIARSIQQTAQQLNETVEKVTAGNGYPIQSLKVKIRELTEHQLQLVEAFQSAHAQLEDLGAMLKDLTVGLVDFYGLRDGEPIFLCWKIGEDRIRFWHALEAGFAGRQPLD